MTDIYLGNKADFADQKDIGLVDPTVVVSASTGGAWATIGPIMGAGSGAVTWVD